MSVIVIDIGNTSTTVGLFRGGRVIRVRRLDSSGITQSAVRKIARLVAGNAKLRGAMIASVVPRVDATWKRALEPIVDGPVDFVRHSLRLGVSIRYPRPEKIGADRLANAAAGVHLFGAPLLVVDFGTAVTFDVVTTRGYEGGIIAPGLPLVFDYLAEKTAKLPHLKALPAKGAWGRSTEQAMQLGARWGYPGLIQAILANLKKRPALRRARVVLTGGHARTIAPSLDKSAVVDSALTLYGIGLIFELNHGTTE
ncbi:MAG: type III pantothenate kinase [Kiritimatiellae bacterium]|nr:type III pantothenate kinase [Kiritimatiellia bacterium]